MVTKEILVQYSDLVEEVKEVRRKIDLLENRIRKTQDRISEIEDGELVKDKVRGGAGGLQSFVIEGTPVKEYEECKTYLMSKKLLLNKRKSTLDELEFELLEKTNEVEEFIASIDDSRMRRIINLRFIENMTWNEVADCIGGGNTEGSIKMAFQRFMEKS